MTQKKWTIIVSIIASFIGACGMYLIVYFFPIYTNKDTIVNRSEKEITITDQGIADAVEKLYDAVVMVEHYRKDTKYGSGTGFVYKIKDGKAYILTNNHVVSGADKIMVTLANGESVIVDVIGSDPYNDLAVMTMSADKAIMSASIGRSEDLRLGDTVFTVGAPLDNQYFGTVTRGIVSGKDRMVEVSVGSTVGNDFIMKVIQTDASINSGNSGGPLANANGEVIGITSLKLVSSGVEGIGFAIPIEDAIEYAHLVEEGKELIRPYLGVSMRDVKSNVGYGAINIDKSLKNGVIVMEIDNESPAAKGGLEINDVVTKINGEDVNNIAQLKYQLYKHNVGDTIKLTINRGGKEKEFVIKLTEKAK